MGWASGTSRHCEKANRDKPADSLQLCRVDNCGGNQRGENVAEIQETGRTHCVADTAAEGN